jgi:poly-gamma-glutamate synthase PgsB/CapB
MRYLLIMIFCLTIYLIYLIIEQISLKKIQKKTPIRICVTGTRGKSGVVRLLAAILRESGLKTLAKVTGSKPVIILPDGREKEIRRIGPANILEQVKIMRLARRLQVEAVVFEIMSINPENHYVESCKIINSQVVAITNIRLDHTGKMGASRAEIAATIGLTIPKSAMVLTNETDYADFFQQIAADRQATAISVPPLSWDELQIGNQLRYIEFRENMELAIAVADLLGIPKEQSLAALVKTAPDFGSLRTWELNNPVNLRNFLAVSAFAANDPESTRKVLDKCREKMRIKSEDADIVGLLNLRADRPERTAQWSDALRNGSLLNIKKIILIGDRFTCLYLQRKLRANQNLEINIVSGEKPEKIMGAIYKSGYQDSVIFGFGNIKGAGEKLINYWNSSGREIS